METVTLISMKRFHDDVMAFHNAMNLPVGEGMKSPEVRDLRCTLIDEEAKETSENGFKEKNWEQVIDGLCDLMYVTIGAAISFGVGIYKFVPTLPPPGPPHPPFWNADGAAGALIGAARLSVVGIHSGNFFSAVAGLSGLVSTIGYLTTYYGIPLEEFWVEVQRANMDKVGGPIRADGKRLKPPGWRGPDHLPLILKHWPGRDDLLVSDAG